VYLRSRSADESSVDKMLITKLRECIESVHKFLLVD
jgi:hypothetical protein